MSDTEEARRLYREALRTSPGIGILILGIFGLIAWRAYEERSGFFFWFYVAMLAGLAVLFLVGFARRGRFLRRASPDEIRKKVVQVLQTIGSTAKMSRIAGFVFAALVVFFPLTDWLKGQPLGRWDSVGMLALASLAFLHKYYVDAPRARRILESLTPGTGQAPSPAT